MTALPARTAALDPVVHLRLARELAADMRPLEEILRVHLISADEFSELMESDHFKRLVHNAAVEWQSAGNTAERVRIKSLAFIEEALPEFYARAHDGKETLNAKVEVLKAVTRLAGIGERGAADGSIGERMVVTINLGQDHKLTIAKDITPGRDIEGEEITLELEANE